MKNKIIALSGQPVSGKGTNVKMLKEKLENRGYTKQNIHIISTGEEFRSYFNLIITLVKNLGNSIKEDEIINNEKMRKIMENEEYRKTVIESIVKLKRSNIDLSNFSVEQANNLKELKDLRKVVDTLIDQNIANLGKELSKEERPGEIWIIDSRLAFHNIPESFSVRLTTNKNVAGERLFNDENRGEEDNKYETIEEAKEAREKRRIGEQKRYKKRYGVDLEDENNYNLIIDTSYSNVDDISDTILKCLDYYLEDKEFAKKWTSPKTLLPLQSERDTFEKALYSLEEMEESINHYGFKPDEPIEIVEVDGIKYIIEGHHRNFASARLGNTLVPYEVLAKDDEKLTKYGNSTAKQRVMGGSRSFLWGHEMFLDTPEESFSYDKIYPGIYDKLKEQEEQGFEI